MTRKLRLLKVIVQPVFVVDDGEQLVELRADPVEVSGREWPTFPEGRFQEGVEALRRQVEGAEGDNGPAA
jgi:hypothetical protein